MEYVIVLEQRKISIFFCLYSSVPSLLASMARVLAPPPPPLFLSWNIAAAMLLIVVWTRGGWVVGDGGLDVIQR